LVDLPKNESFEEIKALENLPNLQILDLSNNPISDEEKHLVGKTAQEIEGYCKKITKKKGKRRIIGCLFVV